VSGDHIITATLTPTNNNFSAVTSSPTKVFIRNRTTSR
jgi:hypothetical protein